MPAFASSLTLIFHLKFATLLMKVLENLHIYLGSCFYLPAFLWLQIALDFKSHYTDTTLQNQRNFLSPYFQDTFPLDHMLNLLITRLANFQFLLIFPPWFPISLLLFMDCKLILRTLTPCVILHLTLFSLIFPCYELFHF